MTFSKLIKSKINATEERVIITSRGIFVYISCPVSISISVSDQATILREYDMNNFRYKCAKYLFFDLVFFNSNFTKNVWAH